MLNAFYISALGMQAQQSQLNVVSTNLSNTNTVAYKREMIDFSALLDRQTQAVGSTDKSVKDTRANLAATRYDMSQGTLRTTGAALDLAVNGAGMFEIALPDDKVGYVRGGSFKVNADGYLTTSAGQLLKTDIRIPTTATNLTVGSDGAVSAMLGNDTQPTELGRLQLVSFANPDALNYLGGGVYEAAAADAQPTIRGNPQETGLGSIAAGALENANVNLVDEMVTMMMAQRVYELNSKVAQAADEMMAMTNSLRRG